MYCKQIHLDFWFAQETYLASINFVLTSASYNHRILHWLSLLQELLDDFLLRCFTFMTLLFRSLIAAYAYSGHLPETISLITYEQKINGLKRVFRVEDTFPNNLNELEVIWNGRLQASCIRATLECAKIAQTGWANSIFSHPKTSSLRCFFISLLKHLKRWCSTKLIATLVLIETFKQQKNKNVRTFSISDHH